MTLSDTSSWSEVDRLTEKSADTADWVGWTLAEPSP